jgi:hypothetical protein
MAESVIIELNLQIALAGMVRALSIMHALSIPFRSMLGYLLKFV